MTQASLSDLPTSRLLVEARQNMPKFLLLTIAFASMLTSLWITKRCMGRSWALSPLFLFVVTSILFVNVGFLVFYARSESEPWALTAVLAPTLGLLLVSLGGALTATALQLPRRWSKLPARPVRLDLSYSSAVSVSLTVFAIVALYFVLLGYVPMLEGIQVLLSGGFVPGLVNTARINRDVYVNPDAKYIPLQGLLEIFRYFGLPVVAVWFLHFRRVKVRERFSTLMIAVALLLIVATGQRWPLMYMLLAIALYVSWTIPNASKLRSAAARLGVVALGAAVLLSALLGRTHESGLSYLEMLAMGAGDLYARVFFGNVEVPFASYGIYGSQIPFLLGASWVQNLASYMPGPAPSFPVTFYQTVVGDQVGYTAPPDFYTEAYVNFGFWGVAFFSILWGSFLAGCQAVMTRAQWTVKNLGIAASLMTVAAFSSMSGVTILVSGSIVCCGVLAVVALHRMVATVAARGSAGWHG